MEENPPIPVKLQTDSANFDPYFFNHESLFDGFRHIYAEHLGHTVFVDNVYDLIHTFIDCMFLHEGTQLYIEDKWIKTGTYFVNLLRYVQYHLTSSDEWHDL